MLLADANPAIGGLAVATTSPLADAHALADDPAAPSWRRPATGRVAPMSATAGRVNGWTGASADAAAGGDTG